MAGAVLAVAIAAVLPGAPQTLAAASPAPLAERLPPEASPWPAAHGSRGLNSSSAPVQAVPDLSFLNAEDRPAGRRGRITAQGEQLMFGDGTPARLWGTNLTAYALFTTHPADVKREAHRLAMMGYNLVRLHHHDSWSDPNLFGTSKAPNTKAIDEAAARRIDGWIKSLRDEGIYVWLDLHGARTLKRGDGIQAFDEIAKGKDSVDLKGYNYVNPDIQAAMRAFAEQYLTRKSAETGLSPIEDPAVAFVLLTNENDLTHHFGNALLPAKNVPWHNGVYMREAKSFSSQHFPLRDAWRSWEHGPSKFFLNDLQHRVHEGEIQGLRKLGLKALVATTNSWGDNPLSSLPALTTGDVIDAHSYGDAGLLEINPVHADNFFDWIASAAVLGKPTTVTEWNAGSLAVVDRHTWPIYTAARAAHQGVAAMMHYAHTQTPPLWQGNASQWDSYADPVWNALMPAAALIFRRGYVAQASSRYVYAPDPQQLFGRAVAPSTAAALRTSSVLGRLSVAMPATPSLPWLPSLAKPVGATVFSDPAAPFIDASAQSATSDTRQLTHEWERGRFQVKSEQVAAVSGWIGSDEVDLGDVRIRSRTPHATVVVTSIDGLPIARSAKLLVSFVARARPGDRGALPYHVEPVQADVAIRNSTGPAGVSSTAMLDGKAGPALIAGGDGFERLSTDELSRSGRNSLILLRGSAPQH